MKKTDLKELQSHLLGSATDAPEALEYFATDGSIFRMEPQGIVYPRNTADVRKVVGFLAARADEPHRKLSLTARGKGTDQSGAALTDGLQLVFPTHMNGILKIDDDEVVVQPGLLYKTLQQTLHTHGRFLPPYPSSIDYSTIGGAVANNAAGELTVKYGATRDFVKKLKVVLDDGSLIETGRISARELNRRKGHDTREGKIYRELDRLIDEHSDLIDKAEPKTSKNAAGYDLWDVKGDDGSFDLTPLIVGSQGTLGVITQITLRTVIYHPRTSLVVGYFDSVDQAAAAIERLLVLKPSALELVDYYLLEYLRRHQPQEIEGVVPAVLPKIVLLVQFNDASQLRQTMKVRRAQRIMGRLATGHRVATDPVEQEALWNIRRSAAAVIWMGSGSKKALPFIEDAVVPVKMLPKFLTATYKLLAKYNLDIAVWGHGGDANLHLQPFLDLGRKKDVDTLFAVADEFFKMVIEMGGSTCGEHNDGLIRGSYLPELFGPEVYDLFVATKAIFDPKGILNPGKKTGVDRAALRGLVRGEYSMKHLYDHMPYM